MSSALQNVCPNIGGDFLQGSTFVNEFLQTCPNPYIEGKTFFEQPIVEQTDSTGKTRSEKEQILAQEVNSLYTQTHFSQRICQNYPYVTELIKQISLFSASWHVKFGADSIQTLSNLVLWVSSKTAEIFLNSKCTESLTEDYYQRIFEKICATKSECLAEVIQLAIFSFNMLNSNYLNIKWAQYFNIKAKNMKLFRGKISVAGQNKMNQVYKGLIFDSNFLLKATTIANLVLGIGMGLPSKIESIQTNRKSLKQTYSTICESVQDTIDQVTNNAIDFDFDCAPKSSMDIIIERHGIIKLIEDVRDWFFNRKNSFFYQMSQNDTEGNFLYFNPEKMKTLNFEGRLKYFQRLDQSHFVKSQKKLLELAKGKSGLFSNFYENQDALMTALYGDVADQTITLKLCKQFSKDFTLGPSLLYELLRYAHQINDEQSHTELLLKSKKLYLQVGLLLYSINTMGPKLSKSIKMIPKLEAKLKQYGLSTSEKLKTHQELAINQALQKIKLTDFDINLFEELIADIKSLLPSKVVSYA